MRDWDPIGIAGVEEAADAYDTYVDRAYVMPMDERANAGAMAAYLLEVASEHMGLSNKADLADRSNQVAIALVALRPEFETH